MEDRVLRGRQIAYRIYDLLSGSTIFRILIPDGIKFYYMGFTMIRFWKVFLSFEYKSLINSKQY